MRRTRYLVAIIIIGLILYGVSALAQVVMQLRQAESALNQLEETDQQLEQHIRELQSDMSEGAFHRSAERIAREKLGLIQPGDTVYRKAGNSKRRER